MDRPFPSLQCAPKKLCHPGLAKKLTVPKVLLKLSYYVPKVFYTCSCPPKSIRPSPDYEQPKKCTRPSPCHSSRSAHAACTASSSVCERKRAGNGGRGPCSRGRMGIGVECTHAGAECTRAGVESIRARVECTCAGVECTRAPLSWPPCVLLLVAGAAVLLAEIANPVLWSLGPLPRAAPAVSCSMAWSTVVLFEALCMASCVALNEGSGGRGSATAAEVSVWVAA